MNGDQMSLFTEQELMEMVAPSLTATTDLGTWIYWSDGDVTLQEQGE